MVIGIRASLFCHLGIYEKLEKKVVLGALKKGIDLIKYVKI